MTFEDALSLIEQKIVDIHYPKQPIQVYEPMTYLMASSGKRIRPVLTLLAYDLYNNEVHEAIQTALAWEILHNFTLMHDDVMDKAEVRRGKLAVHRKWNDNTAILSGDAMLILAYKYIAKSPTKYLKELFDLFSKTAIEICEGQGYDMLFEIRTDICEKEYFDMVRLKTAVMLGACLQSGAIIGGANVEDQNLLYNFGLNLGIAFQIRDDILDAYGDPSVLGKKNGGDILRNKKTYLFICALNNGSDNDRKELFFRMNTPFEPWKKIKAVMDFYDKLHVKDTATYRMKEYYWNAIRTLNKLSVVTKKKTVLVDLAKGLLNRIP